jgi:formylglycine-generating enzyme required for sulfatase activity
MKLKLVPAGSFMMGAPSEERGRRDREHWSEVTISRQFWLGVHPVTQPQYEQVMGANPSLFKVGNRPVEHISWADAVDFCGRMSKLPEEKAAGRAYRLPTEQEWEYACRAGSSTVFGFGDDPRELVDFGWFADNSNDQTQPVGKKRPNAWGFYDMHGNVFEWCQNWYIACPASAATAPSRLSTASFRMLRGGCWVSAAEYCRSAYRHASQQSDRFSFTGFRVALSCSAPPRVG